jgi:hypothetical protein
MSAPAHCGLILRVVAILKTAAKILKQKREEGKENGIRGFPNILSGLRIYFHFWAGMARIRVQPEERTID